MTSGTVFSLAESGSGADLSALLNLVTGAVSGLALSAAGLGAIEELLSLSSKARGSVTGEGPRSGDLMGSRLVFVRDIIVEPVGVCLVIVVKIVVVGCAAAVAVGIVAFKAASFCRNSSILVERLDASALAIGFVGAVFSSVAFGVGVIRVSPILATDLLASAALTLAAIVDLIAGWPVKVLVAFILAAASVDGLALIGRSSCGGIVFSESAKQDANSFATPILPGAGESFALEIPPFSTTDLEAESEFVAFVDVGAG